MSERITHDCPNKHYMHEIVFKEGLEWFLAINCEEYWEPIEYCPYCGVYLK